MLSTVHISLQNHVYPQNTTCFSPNIDHTLACRHHDLTLQTGIPSLVCRPSQSGSVPLPRDHVSLCHSLWYESVAGLPEWRW